MQAQHNHPPTMPAICAPSKRRAVFGLRAKDCFIRLNQKKFPLQGVITFLFFYSVTARPAFTPRQGVIKYVGNPIFVSLSCATANATIYYTADGSDPTPGATSTQQYTSPIAIDNFGATTTIRAIAMLPGHMDSVAVEGTYFLAGK